MGGKRFLKTFPEHLSGSCYFIAHKWSPAMVTKVTNVPTFARSLPLSMVNPPLWILSTELHRFILTGIHIFSMKRENKKGKVNSDICITNLNQVNSANILCSDIWKIFGEGKCLFLRRRRKTDREKKGSIWRGKTFFVREENADDGNI